MALTLESAARLLDRHGLLREIIHGDVWTVDASDIDNADKPFSAITYDTRKVEPGALLCCKGRFKAEYLKDVDEHGLGARGLPPALLAERLRQDRGRLRRHRVLHLAPAHRVHAAPQGLRIRDLATRANLFVLCMAARLASCVT